MPPKLINASIFSRDKIDKTINTIYARNIAMLIIDAIKNQIFCKVIRKVLLTIGMYDNTHKNIVIILTKKIAKLPKYKIYTNALTFVIEYNILGKLSAYLLLKSKVMRFCPSIYSISFAKGMKKDTVIATAKISINVL